MLINFSRWQRSITGLTILQISIIAPSFVYSTIWFIYANILCCMLCKKRFENCSILKSVEQLSKLVCIYDIIPLYCRSERDIVYCVSKLLFIEP